MLGSKCSHSLHSISASCSSRLILGIRCLPQSRPAATLSHFSHPTRDTQLCRAEISPQSGETAANTKTAAQQQRASISTQAQAEEAQARSEAQTIGELKRQQLQSQSQTNVLQGALEEAQLITWPTVKKAFSDTILVIAIVAASGSLLFGVNVLLAEGSQWWYHR